ncbi:MAG: PIG-L deacetylase family protein, partial [Aeromonas sp.]
TLLTFKNPDITDGPTLILSPHPDDAELAAFGFYSDFASQTWIVTISAGELLRKIDKQYLKGLDSDLPYATYRKGFVRAWNSVTTPLLARIPREHLYCLGYFNETVGKILSEPHTPTTNPYNSNIGIKNFRHWNPTPLPGDMNGLHSGDNLVSDLVALIEKIQPSTILVTHPEVDPHKDHIATAKALAMAMHRSQHHPKRILMYANHLRGASHFPYGPEHSRTTLFPWNKEESKFGKWQCYSHPLSLERQKEKIVAFDTMHDLHGKERWEKRLKQWWGKTVLKNGYHYYGNHGYFQTHIKADEVFCWVTGDAFLRGMTEQS